MFTARDIYNFPVEVTGLVMKNLSGNRDALANASLVCKSWSAESSCVLFEELRINLKKPHDAEWLDFLKNCDRIRTRIRGLQLKVANVGLGGKPLKHTFDYLLQAILCLPRLTYLELTCASLKFGPDEAAAFVELCAKQLNLEHVDITYRAIDDMPMSAKNLQCHARVLGAFDKIKKLTIGLEGRRSELANKPSMDVQELQEVPPIRVEDITFKCRTSFSLLTWLCGTMRPAQEPALDLSCIAAVNAEFLSADHHEPVIPPILNLLRSASNIRVLKLNFPFRGNMGHSTILDALRSIDLSSKKSLEVLSIDSLPTASMDYVLDDTKESLRALWQTLMSSLNTGPPSLRTLEFMFDQDNRLCLLNRAYRDAQVSNGVRYYMEDFLHDGRPESISNQVYDWNLLRTAVRLHPKLDTVVFVTPGEPSDSECAWKRYPNTVRVLKEVLPMVRVEFRTHRWR